MEIRSHTSEDLIGPTLHDFVDVVPKRLRISNSKTLLKACISSPGFQGGVFDLNDLTDLTLSSGMFADKPPPSPASTFFLR